ncbi:MAG: DUF3592 domain-containing protein [Isosphaeraceae bacterium]|nr:DUF3592 domain-containing protein [Isosphaeraceae bacterium]
MVQRLGSRASAPFSLRFWGFVFVAVALVSAYFSAGIFLEALASTGWPRAKAIITKAEIRAINAGDDVRYVPVVEYAYEVGDHLYKNTQIRASDVFSGRREEAEKALEGLAVGRTVAVSYKPGHPSRSLLRPGAGQREYARIGLTAGLFLLGAGMLAFTALLQRIGSRRATTEAIPEPEASPLVPIDAVTPEGEAESPPVPPEVPAEADASPPEVEAPDRSPLPEPRATPQAEGDPIAALFGPSSPLGPDDGMLDPGDPEGRTSETSEKTPDSFAP